MVIDGNWTHLCGFLWNNLGHVGLKFVQNLLYHYFFIYLDNFPLKSQYILTAEIKTDPHAPFYVKYRNARRFHLNGMKDIELLKCPLYSQGAEKIFFHRRKLYNCVKGGAIAKRTDAFENYSKKSTGFASYVSLISYIYFTIYYFVLYKFLLLVASLSNSSALLHARDEFSCRFRDYSASIICERRKSISKSLRKIRIIFQLVFIITSRESNNYPTN